MDKITSIPHTRFYHDTQAKGSTCIRALGIHEAMAPGVIRHGGPGGAYLFMTFHNRTQLFPGKPNENESGQGFILWEKDALHEYGNLNTPWDHSWFFATGHFIHRTVTRNELPLNTLLHFDAGDIFVNYLTMLYNELTVHTEQDTDMVEGILALFMNELRRVCRQEKKGIPESIARAGEFIRQHYADKITLRDVAEQATLSQSWLESAFREAYNEPPMQYLNRVRMERAAHLLRCGNLSIKEIAAAVGYKDQLYFSRRFRTFFGTPPSKFHHPER